MDFQALYECDRELLLWLNGSDSLFLDNLMLVLTSGLTWIPLYVSLLYLVVKNSETMNQIFLVVGCSLLCILLSDGITDFVVKPLVMRLRPSNDPLLKYAVTTVNDVRGTGFSFFSAHAANTFSIALFLSMVVKSRMLTITLVLWSLVNCYTRLYLGLHYPSDVLVGLLWGATVGLLAYTVYTRIYAKIAPKINYISDQFTPTGYDKNDLDVVMSVVSLTLVYAIFRTIPICS